MTLTWILEQNVFAEVCFDEMVAHFKARGLPYHIVRIVPFIHEIDGRAPEVTGPCIVYGSIGVQKAAEAHSWAPGVWTNDNFSNSACAASLGDLCVNSSGKIMKLSDALTFMAGQGDTEFFIKPDGDFKQFAGMVLRADEIAGWFSKMIDSGYLEDGEFDVFIDTPKKLGCEWRAVVVNGQISSCSIYRQWGKVMPERHILPEVEAVIMQAHAIFQPAPVYVIDVAQVGDDYKVIEYNTFNSAGLYACDVRKIIDDVTAYLGET